MKYCIIFAVLYLSLFLSSCSKNNSSEPETVGTPNVEHPNIEPPNVEPDKPITLSDKLEALKYYPIKVGNYWRYHYTDHLSYGPGITTTGTFSVEVKDSIIKNGKTYWEFQVKDIYSQTVDHSTHDTTINTGNFTPHSFLIYADVDSAKIFKFDTFNSSEKEVLIENTLIAAKDTMFGFIPCYKILSESSHLIRCESIKNDSYLGQNTTIKSYTGYDTGPFNYKIAKNLGYIYGYSERHGGMARSTQIEEVLEYAQIDGRIIKPDY